MEQKSARHQACAMTGLEHYLQAEKCIEQARTLQADSGPGCGSEELLAEAQVHATLALAAANQVDS